MRVTVVLMLLKLPVNVRGGRRGMGRGGCVNNGRGRCVKCRGAGRGRGHGRGVTVTQRDDEEWQDGHDFQPSTFEFEEHVGVKAEINTDNFTELHFVNLLITDDVLKHLIEQTNLYAKQYTEDNVEYLATKPHAHAKKWKETNKEESVFGDCILSGVRQAARPSAVLEHQQAVLHTCVWPDPES